MKRIYLVFFVLVVETCVFHSAYLLTQGEQEVSSSKKHLAIHDPECPRKMEMTAERKCLKKCGTDLDCRGRNKRCLCDDVCGKSCVKPTKRCENLKMIFNGHYSLKPFNTFGAVVRYTCNEGYILSGQPERVCQGDGYWSGKPPTCETEGKCRDPPDVPNALHDGPLGQSVFPLGTQLTYACSKGYSIDGFFRAMCVGEGRWVGPRMTCSPRRCGHPGDIPHGHREGTIFVYNNRVTYRCSEGYELVGRDFRECKDTGQWSGSLPVCLPVKCPRLSAPANGNIHGNDFTYGAVVKFSCLRGFTLIGSEARRCTQDGTWSGFEASCPMVDCGLPGPFYNGYLDGQQTTFGAMIFFQCFGMTTFHGPSISATCEENGEWSQPIPNCFSRCRVPELVNGSVWGHESGKFADHGVTLSFNCSMGFVLNDTSSPQCYNGSWTFLPECVPAPCTSRPESPRHGMVRYYSTRHGDKAKYICETGYELRGGEDYVVCQYGVWTTMKNGTNRLSVYCAEVYCDHPGTLEFGQILLVGVIGKYEYRKYVKNIGHNDQIEYHCNKGYKRVGPAASTCVHEQWSPPKELVKCVPGKYPKMMYIFRGKRDTHDQLAIGSSSNEVVVVRHGKYNDVLLDGDGEYSKEMVDTDGKYDHFDKGFCTVPHVEHGTVLHYDPSYLVYHGTTLHVRCTHGYVPRRRRGDSYESREQEQEEGEAADVWCDDGMWSGEIPQCHKTREE